MKVMKIPTRPIPVNPPVMAATLPSRSCEEAISFNYSTIVSKSELICSIGDYVWRGIEKERIVEKCRREGGRMCEKKG